MDDEKQIPQVSNIRQSYSGILQLEVDPDILLSFPREERKKLLHNEVERLLLMVDWYEQRKEAMDYDKSQEDKEGN